MENLTETPQKRLELFLKSKNLSKTKFAELLNISAQNLNNYINGNRVFDDFRTIEILKSLGLNINWYIDGTDNIISNIVTDFIEKKEQVIKRIPFYEDLNLKSNFDLEFKLFDSCDICLTVRGNAMTPLYNSGEIVVLKQIYDFDNITYGETYFITTKDLNNTQVLRLIFPSKENHVLLRAVNPIYFFDTEIEKNNIESLYIVKGKIVINI